MSYVKPDVVVVNMIEAGRAKGSLPMSALLIRGVLSGMLLGVATTLAYTFALQTGAPISGALVFRSGS